MNAPSEITSCLEDIRQGRSEAFDRLVGLVYDDLRRMARRHLSDPRSPRVLSPTTLVHEAYLKLADQTRLDYQDRDHFLAACSVVMRNLVIDFARARRAKKRGGDRVRVTLDTESIRIEEQVEGLLALDRALTALAELDPRLARVVECRYFGGLTESETGRALGISERTVRRDWVKSKAVLLEMLSPEGGGE